MAHEVADLEAIEVALLGVLCLGLPPSRATGDDTFRVDHVTAVAEALMAGRDPSAHLEPDGVRVSARFNDRLREAIRALTSREILIQQAIGMPAAAGGYEAGLLVDMVTPDEHPVVLDRYLAQQCMETLFRVPAVYPFLMLQYTRSGEFWQKARAGGYGQ
jgi:hypothetical protein